jgi:hypothetical protein
LNIPGFFSVEYIECQKCKYKIIKPYPKDQLCPRCGEFIPELFEKEMEEEKPKPKEFQKKSETLSTRMKGKVKVKGQDDKFSLDDDKIELKKGEYIKLLGITTVERVPLYCSNENYVYLLELTNNLDFIATGMLSGELDKMLLISEESGNKEKCQFYVKNGLIYIIYGIFPDKKGKWVLEQMEKHFFDMVKDKDINNLDKLEKYQIEKKFQGIINFILKEYMNLQAVFSDQDIPYLEDKIQIDYLGLSSKSIGVISLLVNEDAHIEVPGVYDSMEEEIEMKETVLTAKIEAIAANTLGNTGAMPRWIAVRLGFQDYRFLTFKQYKNDYFLYSLSKGNLEKLRTAEEILNPFVLAVVDEPFSGNLRPFNKVKATLKKFLNEKNQFS